MLKKFHLVSRAEGRFYIEKGYWRTHKRKEKYCAKCGESKPFSAFTSDSTQSDGLDYYCQTCRRQTTRVSNLKRRYNKQLQKERRRVAVQERKSAKLNRLQEQIVNEQILDCLTNKQKTVVSLFAEGLKRKQVAKELGVSLQAVNQIVPRIRTRVKERIGIKIAI